MGCKSVILATGSSPIGHTIAKQLGHDITKPVPSLFTLNSNKIVKNSKVPFYDLAGVSVPKVKVAFRVKGKKQCLNENTNAFKKCYTNTKNIFCSLSIVHVGKRKQKKDLKK